MRVQRTDKSRLAQWWFAVDQPLLFTGLLLLGIGLMLSLVASPSIAVRRDLDVFYFVKRHLAFACIAALAMFVVSLMRPVTIRRSSLALAGLGLGAMTLAAWIGPEIKGAQRWLVVGGFQFQPTEVVKPALVMLLAWALADRRRHADMPALAVVTVLILASMAVLTLQKDIGQIVLLAAVSIALHFVAGRPLVELGGLLSACALAGLAAYHFMEHFRSRIDRYLSGEGDLYQMKKAHESFVQGGWFGRGPGEGTIKTSVPDAHTDYILAVVAEEYGVIACLALLALFGFLIFRSVLRAWHEPDPEIRLAIFGLALLIGMQALINIGVNVGLLPTKGMTLPFISYGGSSLLGSGITLGIILALTRRTAPLSRSRGIILFETASR